MLVCRVSVPPTSPTSNKPHITTNVLQNLISIVTKSVKTKGDILACIILKLSFAVWHDRVTCYVNICAMLSCLKIVFIQFISLIGRDFDFQRWNICCRYSKRKIKSRDGETFSINWKSKDNHPTTCPSVFFHFLAYYILDLRKTSDKFRSLKVQASLFLSSTTWDVQRVKNYSCLVYGSYSCSFFRLDCKPQHTWVHFRCRQKLTHVF